MGTIRVNDKLSFENIVWLADNGYLPHVKVSAQKNSLTTGADTFILEEGFSSSLDKDATGGRWFAGLRKDSVGEYSLGAWNRFVDNAVSAFYRKYSFLSYDKTGDKITQADRERHKQGIRNVLSFCSETCKNKEFLVRASDKDAVTTDVYGVVVKLNLSTGSSSFPALNRFFFRVSEEEIGFVSPAEAAQLDKTVNEIEKYGEASSSSEDEGATSLSAAHFSAISERLSSLIASEDFADFINLSEGSPEYVEVERYIQSMEEADREAEIICTGASIRYLFRIKWKSTPYDVIKDGRILFRATVGFGGEVSLECALCGEPLAEFNRIKTVEIDPSREDLGLNDAEQAVLVANNPFDAHASEIPCCRIKHGLPPRYVCEKDWFFSSTDGEELGQTRTEKTSAEADEILDYGEDADAENLVRLCKDCPHLETVFRIPDGEGTEKAYYTPTLTFCRDKMTLLPRAQTETCEFCGRTFGKGGLKKAQSEDGSTRNVCSLCYAVCSDGGVSPDVRNKGKKLYAKHALLLSYGVRVKGTRKTKLCAEDAELIVFRVGNRRFIFDKRESNGEDGRFSADNGFLPPPCEEQEWKRKSVSSADKKNNERGGR